MAQQCSMCSNPSAGRCEGCKCSAYCSKDCQVADWPIHRLLCKQLQSFATPPKPSDRRGVYFPVDKVSPRFVWVPTVWVPDEENFPPGYEKFDAKPYIGDEISDSVRLSRNALRSRIRENQVHLVIRDTALVDGSAPNRATAAVTKGVSFYPWCGSVLAMKLEDGPSGDYLHMDTVDFRDAVDLLRSYTSSLNINIMSVDRAHKGAISPLDDVLKREAAGLHPVCLASCFQEFQHTNLFPHSDVADFAGVRINCVSDLAARGNQMFEAVQVSSKDSIWHAPITSISNLVDLPVMVRRILPGRREANPAVKFLHMLADPQSKHWGWAFPWEWQLPAGSCLVVHAERKKLSPKEVERLCSFCQDFLQPLFDTSVQSPENWKLKKAVLRHLTPNSFAQFCADCEDGTGH